MTTSTSRQTRPAARPPSEWSDAADAALVRAAVARFIAWLDRYGETSWDHQTFFASAAGRRAKALYYRSPALGMLAVSPMILCEAFLPWTRALFYPKQRFPIADAHYAKGFALLSRISGDQGHYRRAVHFLSVLEETRCPGFTHYGWGYPFDWETRTGTMRQGTPLITTLPYVYEAFRSVHEIDGDPRWRKVMASIAAHAAEDYHDVPTSANAASCSYTPAKDDPAGVINASAYRAFLLTRASVDFGEAAWRALADRNLRFVIESQNADGSWFYAVDGQRDFIDHFHTCFILKALAKLEGMTADPACSAALDRGLRYYVANLFDESGMPRPFSRRPRLTVYRRELYDIAECINLAVLLRGRRNDLEQILSRLLTAGAWQKRDGSFRSRQLLIGWDNVPMHRWAQSQMFASLCSFLYDENCRQQRPA